MKQEYIDLLRKDIAARLPYEPVVVNERYDGGFGHRLHLGDLATSKYLDSIHIEDTKVYLRSLSSMTEEEMEELEKITYHTFKYEKGDCEIWTNSYHRVQLFNGAGELYGAGEPTNMLCSSSICIKLIDWLNAHHFDYRGLIKRGLAIEVTEENNPYVHRTYADMMKSKNK